MRRISAAVLAAAALAVTASPASAAGDVWLWACHGPSGQGLATGPLVAADGSGVKPFAFAPPALDADVVAYGDACAGSGSDAGGLTGRFARADPAGNSTASVTVAVPPGLALVPGDSVTLTRATTGLGGDQTANPQIYTAHTGNTALESSHDAGWAGDVSGEHTFSVANPLPSGDYVRLSIACSVAGGQQCPPGSDPVSFRLSRVGLHVVDASDPQAALNAHTPAQGDVAIGVQATDVGTGLAGAQVLLDGVLIDTEGFGGERCRGLSGAGQIDLPVDEDCPHTATTGLRIPHSELYPDGNHTMVVRVFDAAGRKWEKTSTLELTNHLLLPPSSATTTVGTDVPTSPAGQGGSNRGGVAAASATSCTSPKLSMVLATKPLRVSHGVPVLKRNKAYEFTGTLTCRVGRTRKAAPRHARIDLDNRVGKRTVDKHGTTVAGKGKIAILLRYPSSRTLIFRFVNGDGKSSQVKIRVKVARK